MDTAWMSAPSLAIKLWRDAGNWRWRINSALRAWSLVHGTTPQDWQSFADVLIAHGQQVPPLTDQRVLLFGVPVRAVFHAAHHDGQNGTNRDTNPAADDADDAAGQAWLVWLSEMASNDTDSSPATPPAQTNNAPMDSLRPAQLTPELLSGRLARAANLASVAIWRIDLKTQRIEFNDFGYQMNNVRPRADGLALELVRTAVHPDDVQALADADAAAIECDGVVDVEARFRTADGSFLTVLTRRVAERDEHGRAVAIAGVSIDQTTRITERDQRLALMRNMELVTDAGGIGVWSIDLASGQVEWNRQMYLMYDLPEGSTTPSIGEWMDQRMHADDRVRVAKERRAALDAGVDLDTEFRIVRPDGSHRHVVCRSRREVRGGREWAHGIHVDITQRRATESRLHLLEQRALLANQAVRVGTWERNLVTDDSQWDDQMYALRGLAPDDPRSPNELRRTCVHPEDLPEMLARVERGYARGEASDFDFEFRVIWPDGSVHWLNARGMVLQDEKAQAVRAVGVNWDITQRKVAEQSLRDKLTAEQASRTKSEFLSSMSHELRTPLNAVLGFAQLLLMDTTQPLAAEHAHRVDRIRTAGQHLLALIDDVLDIAAVESGVQPLNVETVALHEVLGEAMLWMEPQAVARDVRMHLESTPAWLNADTRRVRQVVVNLLSNAIKYNRHGGDVWVSIRRADQPAEPSWELTVRDSGRGLSAAQMALIFEPFNRLGLEHEGIEGTGIGLTIVRDLVQRMGGRITVTSEPGQGSQFSVCWPLGVAPKVSSVAEAVVGAAESPLTASVPSGMTVSAAPTVVKTGLIGATLRPLNLLYIEDNPVNVVLMQELLAQRPNVSLRSAVNGASGLSMALEQVPDALLIDMQLPDFDGMEVLRRVKANPALGSVRLIALSANAMPEDVAGALAAGFDDYWTKPIDMKKILEQLDALSL